MSFSQVIGDRQRMVNSVRGVLRRTVLKALILALAGCGGGEPVVVQSKSNRLDRIKGPETKAQAPGDPKTAPGDPKTE
jgi:hypothetical protein